MGIKKAFWVQKGGAAYRQIAARAGRIRDERIARATKALNGKKKPEHRAPAMNTLRD